MARAGASKKGRVTRAPRNPVNETVMPDVYREMLADAVSSSPSKFNEEGQPVKRRRVGGRVVKQSYDEMAHYLSDQASTDANHTDIERSRLESQAARKQTAYTESDGSADSDIDWEEVDLKDSPEKYLSEQDIVEDQELNLVLGADDHDTRRRSAARRKPASAADKKLRLEIHKMHLLSLLVHVHRRNHWCNDEDSHVCHTQQYIHRHAKTLIEDTEKPFGQAYDIVLEPRQSEIPIPEITIFCRWPHAGSWCFQREI